VVGCDGKQTKLRQALGIGFSGKEYSESFLICDAELSESDVHAKGMDKHEGFATLKGGKLLLMVHLEKNTWRVYHAASSLDQEATSAGFLERVCKEVLPGGQMPEVVRWKDPSFFTLSCRIVDAYSSGRCFLAGDAAHCHSPAGGQGMNTGLQDSANLAWKLAAVLSGCASSRLLASFEPERRPVAEWVLRTSDGLIGRVADQSLPSRALRWIAVRLLLPLIPGSALPPVGLKNRLFGLTHSYSGTGACVDSGPPPPAGALRAGDRLPDLSFSLGDGGGGEGTTLLQALRPLRLALHLLFVGPSAQGDEEAARATAALGSRCPGWALEAWLLHDAPTGRGGALPGGAGGAAARHLVGTEAAAELRRLLALGPRGRALLLVRPDGHIAAAHRGGWDGDAMADAAARCGLSAASG